MAKADVSNTLRVLGQAAWNVIDGVNVLARWDRRPRRARRPTRPSVRKLALRGSGAAIKWVQRHTHSTLQGALPISGYTTRLRLGSEDGHSCIAGWSSDSQLLGTPGSAAVTVICGTYQAGFENLWRMFGGKPRPPHGEPRGRSAPSVGTQHERQREEWS
jgi:hypothetical protein